MKAKYFLFGFLLLTLGAFCSTANTRAADYELGISENDEFIWEIKIVDEAGLKELFEGVEPQDGGTPWQQNAGQRERGEWISDNKDEVGAKLKVKVDWINESDVYVIEDKEEGENVEIDVWEVYVDIWDWIDPDNDFNPEPDHVEHRYRGYQDPDDVNTKTYTDMYGIDDNGANIYNVLGSSEEILFTTTPVEDFLDELEWRDEDWIPYEYASVLSFVSDPADEDDITYEYEVDGNVVRCEKSFVYDDDDDNPSTGGNDWEYEDFIEEWTFDESTGWLSLYQVMNDDEEVLYEYALVTGIPGYELPILLGVTAAFTIGLIYIIRKRM